MPLRRNVQESDRKSKQAAYGRFGRSPGLTATDPQLFSRLDSTRAVISAPIDSWGENNAEACHPRRPRGLRYAFPSPKSNIGTTAAHPLPSTGGDFLPGQATDAVVGQAKGASTESWHTLQQQYCALTKEAAACETKRQRDKCMLQKLQQAPTCPSAEKKNR
mmetsp:Transcript_66855/g.118648  ORF Transcript_66855/g.118648 Transcript_66855/m.118648 type:complete len:162 (+) Transcript_66855:68-553(+)